MRTSEMFAVLDVLQAAGVRSWVAGGFGVAVLTGRVTREHRDLDLMVHADDLSTALRVLATRGYAVETDWLPCRVEVAGPAGWVDLHPVVFAADGSGRQAGLADDTWFDYPPGTFVEAVLDGRVVPCVSRAAQILAHRGYPLRDQDRHDLAELRRLEETAGP